MVSWGKSITEYLKHLGAFYKVTSISSFSDEALEEHASGGETPSADSLTEFKQVKMYAQNQIILTKVLNEERDQVCVIADHKE